MTSTILNLASAVFGIIAPVLLAIGQHRRARALELTLTGLEVGVESVARGAGPIFEGLDVQRQRAANASRYFVFPGWVCLAMAFALRLVALISN
jgi:hypothetical protein